MVIKRVTDKEEISGIKALQTSNLKSNLTEAEMIQEGFLTASYSLEFLDQMHQLEPAVVAKDGDAVVGYALAVTKALYGHHDLLNDLFTQIDAHRYKGQLLADVDYVVVGQLCGQNPPGYGACAKVVWLFPNDAFEQISVFDYRCR